MEVSHKDIVATDDGSLTLKQPVHGEEFHSRWGARSEAITLYLQSSGLSAALLSGGHVTVLDVGLGLGYNATEAIRAWQDFGRKGNLTILSLEIEPKLVQALQSGNAPWQHNWDKQAQEISMNLAPTKSGWLACWDSTSPQVGSCRWEVIIGDACETPWQKRLVGMPCNFVWQDAFSPTKNPKLWTQDWFQKIRDCCHKDAILVTYSVARQVKDALVAAGFAINKIPASGTKRQWLRAQPRK